jgi:integrase
LAPTDLSELYKRLDALPENKVATKNDAEALLGVIPKPHILLSQAFEVYCDEIAIGDVLGKSKTQASDWKKVKNRAVRNFIAVCGDMPMSAITRVEARKFYNWWGAKLKPKGNRKALSPNSANRDLGNLRLLYTKYWEYEGQESRANPFRKLNFKEDQIKDVPHFEDKWVRSRILEPEIFTSLNRQAILIIYSLIETGCRPSEISNILPENIVMDHDVPHIRIRKQANRQLKTNASVRDIPLLGVSLIAMRNALAGFQRYHDKGNLLSVSLLKAFRRRSLFPTNDHRIYSFRHSFEKRMLEAGLDYDLRCLLMGHKNTRPQYGDGGSLEYRHAELSKITHPVPIDFEKRLLAVCEDNSKSNQYTKRIEYIG